MIYKGKYITGAPNMWFRTIELLVFTPAAKNKAVVICSPNSAINGNNKRIIDKISL